MSEFEREERYIVIKLKDIDGPVELTLRDFLLMQRIPTCECVVVEPDWPIYDETWDNVQRLVEDRPSIREERDALAAHVERLRAGGENAYALIETRLPDWVDELEALRAELDNPPETSLARLIAEKQAEGIRAASNRILSIGSKTHKGMLRHDRYMYISSRALKEYAEEILSQSEEAQS